MLISYRWTYVVSNHSFTNARRALFGKGGPPKVEYRFIGQVTPYQLNNINKKRHIFAVALWGLCMKCKKTNIIAVVE